MFILLLRNNGEWVPIETIRAFTKEFCKSECFPIHSRASDLRSPKKYGYPVENKTESIDGVTHSYYRIKVTDLQLKVLRELYRPNKIPKLSTVNEKITGKEAELFKQKGCAV
jgi:hypothetical protein